MGIPASPMTPTWVTNPPRRTRRGSENPSTRSPNTRSRSTGKPNTRSPNTGSPNTGNLNTGNLNTGNPSTGNPRYGQPGYPMPGYQLPGYGGPPRPGGLTAAAVLAYVAAGLLIFAGILLFFGASVINSFDTIDGGTASGGMLTAELAFDGLLNLLSGGLLISGAVMFTGGRATGRVLMSIGSGIVIVESIYWALRTGGDGVAWSVLFAAIVIVALSLAWTAGATRWLTQVAAAGVRR